MKKLVIFDMDGTLIDSSKIIANSINYVRYRLSLEPLAVEDIVQKVNDNSINPARYFYHKESFDPEHTEWFNHYYTHNHKNDLELYDGVPQMLQKLKEQGTRIALATNAYRVSTIESVRSLDIEKYFDAIMCVDDVPEGKPDPDMLFKITDLLGASVHESVFIGDGPRDSQAAANAQMDYLMVDWGFTEHKEDIEVITSMEKLTQKLFDITKREAGA